MMGKEGNSWVGDVSVGQGHTGLNLHSDVISSVQN
jgi:hypothetical protein